ncbi:hypothetical protein Tco_1225337, partial [Tanacetum coccineum]
MVSFLHRKRLVDQLRRLGEIGHGLLKVTRIKDQLRRLGEIGHGLLKVNKSAKKNEDKASEVPHGTLTTWNAGISSTTNNSLSNNVNSGASYSSTKPNVDEEGRKKVNLSGLSSKKRAHKEVSIPLYFENLSFSVTNPIADHALLATPTNLVNEPAKKKKDEANEPAKKKKDEAKELAKKKKEEAIELAKKKKEEAIELAKKKKEEAIELANKKKEEANELAKKKIEEAVELANKKKEEAIELAKKKKEEAIELAKKKEEAIELAKKKKQEAIELAKKKKEEANELAKKKKEEAIELAKKKKEEAIELAKKRKEEAIELAKKKKEAANELSKKKKDEANELAKKKKDEAIPSSTKPKVNKEGRKLDNLVRPLSKKRAHKEVSTPRKNGKLLPSVTNPEADHAHVTTPTNLVSLFSSGNAKFVLLRICSYVISFLTMDDLYLILQASSTNAAQFNNIPGMSGLASPYYSNVGNITSSLAVKGVIDVVDDSATKCPKDISGKSSEIVTHGDTTSLYGGISRKINTLFDNYADLQPTALSNYIDIDEEIAHPLSSKQPLIEISSSPWNDEKLLSSSSSTNVTDPKNLGSKASLQEVIPYVSIDELDTYEDSKTLNFSQH